MKKPQHSAESDILTENNEPIMAMAIINPKLCRLKSIRVKVMQVGEGSKAHVHVYWDDGKITYIDLSAPIYAEHHHGKKGELLDRKTRDDFIEIMASVWDKYAIELARHDESGALTNETYFTKATGYEASVQIWTDTYGDDPRLQYEKDGRPIMPDYTKLPVFIK